MVRIKKNNFVYNKNIYQCIVPECQNVDNDTNDPSIYFFIISEDGVHKKLLIKFLENIPIRPKISRICSAHFADNCFELHNGVKLLKPNALPTIRPAQNPTPGIDKINNKSSVKSDELIQNIANKKIDIKNDDNVLMGPPQTTVVKKSQLKNVQRDPTTLSPPKDQQSKHLQSKQLDEKSQHLQPLNGHLQVGRQEEQLGQLSYRQELQLLRQQNKNLQYQPHQEQHNKTFEKEPVLAQHQRQQQGNGESNDSNQTKSLCHRQQQKNKSNIKTPEKSKQSLQQNENQEELKWLEQQKHVKNKKQQLKRLQELKKVERHNRNLSQQKQHILPKHKQQEQLMEELKRRPEQHHQNSRHLKELLLAPPLQEQQYHLMLLQRDYLKNQKQNLENCQRQNHHQQLQPGDVHNQKQKQSNQKEHQQLQLQKQQDYNQQFQQQQKHLPQQKLHSLNNLNLERSQSSLQLQHQYKHKQMEFEQQQHSQSQLQEKQHILPERQLLNVQSKKQEQPKSQTPSPIPDEEEYLIMCGYITFESCNNNFSYSCGFCSKNLENLNGFSAHLIRLHTNEIENEINSKRLNKGDKVIAKETNMKKQKCGIISISSKLYNLFLNYDFKFDCNFCDKKFEAINKFSEHIGKRHLDLLEKDQVNDMEYEDDIEIDPSCILSFDQIDEINEIDNFLNSLTSNNNISNNKIVMSVPMSDNSEIFMTLDINENNTNNIKNNKSCNKEIIEEQNIPMELDSLEKPKLKVNIKHSSWATRYFS